MPRNALLEGDHRQAAAVGQCHLDDAAVARHLSALHQAAMNRLLMGRARRRDGKTMGMNLLVLTTIGRKSGQARATPLAWFPASDGGWLVVASAGGAAANPAWYLNLAAHPDRVTVEQAGRKVAVTAEELHGAEREQAWKQITSEAAQFRKYEETTDRELPVIRLTPR